MVRRWTVFALAILFALLVAPGQAAAAPPLGQPPAGGEIEQRSTEPGPYRVTRHDVTDPASGGRFALFLPEGGDQKYPIVTWGNGTGARPDNYESVLRHLASWGFAAIDSYNSQTGSGTDILAGAKYLLRRNGDGDDPLHDRLDPDRVAAVGHSQGATGVLNANRLAEGAITTTVPIGLPTAASGAGLVPLPANVQDLTGPTFFIAGGLDLLICPPSGIVAAYRDTDGPAAVATRREAEHILLVQTTVGYITAWLRYQLRDDRDAARAFVGSSPEIRHNPLWADQASKDLPPAGETD